MLPRSRAIHPQLEPVEDDVGSMPYTLGRLGRLQANRVRAPVTNSTRVPLAEPHPPSSYHRDIAAGGLVAASAEAGVTVGTAIVMTGKRGFSEIFIRDLRLACSRWQMRRAKEAPRSMTPSCADLDAVLAGRHGRRQVAPFLATAGCVELVFRMRVTVLWRSHDADVCVVGPSREVHDAVRDLGAVGGL
jgi:hypothetical protein